jgi:hypothetical protein
MIEMQRFVEGYIAGRLSPRQHHEALIRRPWTRNERLVVIQGVAGRACIAIEPTLCGLTFLALTVGMFFVRTDPNRPGEHNMLILAPIFAIGALASTVYACAVM